MQSTVSQTTSQVCYHYLILGEVMIARLVIFQYRLSRACLHQSLFGIMSFHIKTLSFVEVSQMVHDQELVKVNVFIMKSKCSHKA